MLPNVVVSVSGVVVHQLAHETQFVSVASSTDLPTGDGSGTVLRVGAMFGACGVAVAVCGICVVEVVAVFGFGCCGDSLHAAPDAEGPWQVLRFCLSSVASATTSLANMRLVHVAAPQRGAG